MSAIERFLWMLAAILAVFLMADETRADVVATSPNTGGGQIVLTDVQASCPSGTKQAFARGAGGSAIFGCWTYNDSFVFVKYTDGDVRIYNAANFEVAGKYAKSKGDTL